MPFNEEELERLGLRLDSLPSLDAEGGQGESSGPSLFSLRERFPTGFYDGEDGVGRPYWTTYGSQERERYLERIETGTASYINDSYSGYTWNLTSLRETRERGEQMRFSGKPDPITTSEMASLERFYRRVLLDGYGSWPLSVYRLPFFIDGKNRSINIDSRWSYQEGYLYIGSSRDEGVGELSSPAARLAITSTLMGITGHSGNQELIGLLSERLAKVMAGVYESVVSPLAETLDSRPIRRMAWSTSGGLASWVDGEWVGLTGEPVAVGTDWIVIDTEEGPIEEELPEVTPQVLFAEPEEIPIPF